MFMMLEAAETARADTDHEPEGRSDESAAGTSRDQQQLRQAGPRQHHADRLAL